MEEQEDIINLSVNELAKELKPLILQMNRIYDEAVAVYTPLVDELCSRNASENEVGWMLDWMLQYAGNERMLQLYKQVCRSFWKIYPESITFYIMEYKKEFDPDSLIGTEYEYLLHNEDNMEE